MAIQDPITEFVIGCCFPVANELGPGFLEKVYENALAHALGNADVAQGLKYMRGTRLETCLLVNFGQVWTWPPHREPTWPVWGCVP
jgi:hypothetical protein